MQRNTWISKWPRLDQPKFRIFGFHHAGGSTAAFVGWEKNLPPDVELCCIQIPGHWERPKENLVRGMSELVSALDQSLVSELNVPFAVVGYSLGALIGFEWLRQLRLRSGPMPFHFVSIARSCPKTPAPSPALHTMTDDHAFLNQVEKLYGQLPASLKADAEIFNFFVTILKADLQILETYQYQQEPPLNVPITCVAGMNDVTVTNAGFQGWEKETTAVYSNQRFPGGHLVLKDSSDAVIKFVVQRLAQQFRT